MKGIIKLFDLINEYAGRATSIIIYFLLLVVVYEVISRKVFNAPTVWGFDLSFMLYSTMFLLGGGYTLKYSGHVAIDVFTSRLPKRKQAIISLITYLIFFFPFMFVLIYVSGAFALQSWIDLERSQSPWNQPLYHFKTLMPIGFTLLMIQGISEFLKTLLILKKGDK
ncbi:MAG: TRAP transporter small permease subunit [Thermodesulfovibrionales bacterium]|nr:TRAP transporter small permease subunit [Thermodesulfovibrionales bacterium]